MKELVTLFRVSKTSNGEAVLPIMSPRRVPRHVWMSLPSLNSCLPKMRFMAVDHSRLDASKSLVSVLLVCFIQFVTNTNCVVEDSPVIR